MFLDEEQEIIREFERAQRDEKLNEFLQAGSIFEALTLGEAEGIDQANVNPVVRGGAEILLDPSNVAGAGVPSKIAKFAKSASRVAKGVNAQALSEFIERGSKAIKDHHCLLFFLNINFI